MLKSLVKTTDIVIDPFRPGVLEKLGLGPDVLHSINPRIIVARVTGYRRTGAYRAMAGHDINYLAVSGTLALLGEAGQRPTPPVNILGDFAGGGHVAFSGILLALVHRFRTGKGQVVEANMVDGAAYLATFPRLHTKTEMNGGPRGTNTLDGGAPFYGCYGTRDGKWMAVGALEARFFDALCAGLGIDRGQWTEERRLARQNWPELRRLMEGVFARRTRHEWEAVFDGTDACVAPVLENDELERRGYDQRPMVGLTESPLWAVARGRGHVQHLDSGEGQGEGTEDEGWNPTGLAPGEGGEKALREWLGWERGKEYDVESGGALVAKDKARL